MNTTLTQGEKTVWINVPLTPELRKRIKVVAAQREISARDFIVNAVVTFMDNESTETKKRHTA